MIKNPRLFFVFILITSFFCVKSVNAQTESLNVTVNPVFFEFIVAPNEKIKDTVRIFNNNTTPLEVQLSVQKMIADESGKLTLAEIEPTDDFDKWIRLSEKKITLPVREWVDVSYTIDIPSSAAYGYYPAIAITKQGKTNDANAVTISGSAIVPVLINVKKENAKLQAELIEFKSVRPIYQYLPADLSTVIKNTGNVHIRPRGNIFIKGKDNSDIALLEVNENSGSILPDAQVTYTNSWNDGFITRDPILIDGTPVKNSDGQIEKKLTFHWDKLTSFRFGPYTAHLFLVFDNGTRDVTLEGSTTFWVIPYTALTVLLISLILIIFLFRKLLQYRDKKLIKQYLNKQSSKK